MKGKIGLVVGLGVGYVLGSRAGRERYEQIKTQWLKVWNLDPVQEQVTKVQTFVGDKAAAVPGAVWNGVVRVAKAATGSGTPEQRLDAVIATSDDAVEEVAKATRGAATAAKKPAASTRTSTASAAKKTTAAKTTPAKKTES